MGMKALFSLAFIAFTIIYCVGMLIGWQLNRPNLTAWQQGYAAGLARRQEPCVQRHSIVSPYLNERKTWEP